MLLVYKMVLTGFWLAVNCLPKLQTDCQTDLTLFGFVGWRRLLLRLKIILKKKEIWWFSEQQRERERGLEVRRFFVQISHFSIRFLLSFSPFDQRVWSNQGSSSAILAIFSFSFSTFQIQNYFGLWEIRLLASFSIQLLLFQQSANSTNSEEKKVRTRSISLIY